MSRWIATGVFAFVGAALPDPARAAEALDGARLSAPFAIPLIGLLLCIATGPVLYPHVWERHYGKIAAVWATLAMLSLFGVADSATIATTLTHTVLLEYLPFVLLLLALFTTAGGIYVEGNLHDSAFTNTVLLTVGMILASVVGTTGASMILIRPLIRANDDRERNAHVVVFFIFLVSNIGGALTPLGDPPLFLGFLLGVDFFWTTQHLLAQTVLTGGIVLLIFVALDIYIHHREGNFPRKADPTPDSPLKLHGTINFGFIGVIVMAILISAYWKPGIGFTVSGVTLELQNILRDIVLIAVTIASVVTTRQEHRTNNGFSWSPIVEVAMLFAGIFVCIAPVMAMLAAGADGAFASCIKLAANHDGSPNPLAYFWLTGGLSAFLDNAPTYLIFFELAGGDPNHLMTTGAKALQAISAGAVFMGAMTYIGNAPNFMVYAIARQSGVKMPGFFGYMLWSGLILLPVFALTGWLAFG